MGHRLIPIAVALSAVPLLAAWGLRAHVNGRLETTHEVHHAPLPVPWPLSKAEREELVAEGLSAEAIRETARQQALARGEHLVTHRAGCLHCHGDDGAGGIVAEGLLLGRLTAPNITPSGVVAAYDTGAWERVLRHGLLADGRVSLMASTDYLGWTDRDVSDAIVYLETLPPVDSSPPPGQLGPLGYLAVALGRLPLSAEAIDHSRTHPKRPPEPAATIDYGAYLASGCRACHGDDLRGGPVRGGAPDWPVATSLWPTGTGGELQTYPAFEAGLRRGIGSDGRDLHAVAMPWPRYSHLSDLEVEALYTYLSSLPAQDDDTPSSH